MLGDDFKPVYDNLLNSMYVKPLYGNVGNNVFNDRNTNWDRISQPPKNSYYDTTFDALYNKPPLGSPGNLIFDAPKTTGWALPIQAEKPLPNVYKDPVIDNSIMCMSSAQLILAQANPMIR